MGDVERGFQYALRIAELANLQSRQSPSKKGEPHVALEGDTDDIGIRRIAERLSMPTTSAAGRLRYLQRAT